MPPGYVIKTAEDWLQNWDAIAILFPDTPTGSLVHQGFDAVYQRIRNSVIAGVDAANVNATFMWIAGHSLGGAIALLAAIDFGKNTVPRLVSQLYTFAGPRVGDACVQEPFRCHHPSLLPCRQPLGHSAAVATTASVHSCGAVGRH